MNNNITVSVQPVTGILDVRDKWCPVESHSNASFFLSWKWIEAWLNILPHDIRPLLLNIERNSCTAGAGLLVQGSITRHKIIKSNCIYLNESGLQNIDALTIEHNGLLLDEILDRQACMKTVLSTVCLEILGWDEFIISGINEMYINDYFDAANENNLNIKVLDKKPYYFINLMDIRLSERNYIDHLSSNTRQQLRRTI
jgi:hypothetical protein